MKKYKAELWDKMQHIMERYNDHMAHCYFEFDSQLNFELMKKAVGIVCDKIQIFKTRFAYTFFKAEWIEKNDFSIDDIVEIVEVETDARKISENFLTQKLDELEKQIKVLIVRCKGHDTLNILLNHMVMDGADIKSMVKLLAEVYTNLCNGGSGDIPFKNGRRDEAQLLESFGKEERKKVERLVSYSKKSKDKIKFPFEQKTKEGLKPFIETLVIDEMTFLKAKSKAKKLGFTINDLVVASFYRAIYKVADITEGQCLGVPCMVDLRKYLANGESQGATNLTSMVVCNIGSDIGNEMLDTLGKVKIAMTKLKNDYPGLHGLPLLRGVFKYAPYMLAKFLIGTFFKNPLLGISNIGIIDEKAVMFNGKKPEYLYWTGSIKYPPYYQLALTTYLNQITFSTAVYGTKNDRIMIKRLFRYIANEIEEFCFKG